MACLIKAYAIGNGHLIGYQCWMRPKILLFYCLVIGSDIVPAVSFAVCYAIVNSVSYAVVYAVGYSLGYEYGYCQDNSFGYETGYALSYGTGYAIVI